MRSVGGTQQRHHPYRKAMSDFDGVLVEELRFACETARRLAAEGTTPTRELPRLIRRAGELQFGYREDGPRTGGSFCRH